MWYTSEKRWYKAFCKRYAMFRVEDIVNICGDHHEEIHEIYNNEMLRWQKDKKLPWFTRDTTRAQAKAFMKRCEEICNEWLKVQTPGSKARRLTNMP
jgi:hypothetical protein